MHALDWIVVGVYLVWIVQDGLKRTKDTKEVEGYFLANRSLPWWAVGLSVMATQLSAITLVGTTGQGYADGMRFVQFYFGLPIAMVILSVTLVPFFYRARVFTAYEYLEKRFDLKTRTLASVLFLMSRGLSCGAIIAAPAVIFSIVLGWNLTLTILAIGLPAVALHDDRRRPGGHVDRRQADGDRSSAGCSPRSSHLIVGLPENISLGQALHVAGAAGRLNTIDFHFDWRQTYTFWSGLLGGLFLMLSYFGCDQSQVQRYLTAKSVQEGRHSLMISAYVKIPLQALVLLTGVLVFVFYLFNEPPMLVPACGRPEDPAERAWPRAGGARIRVLAGVRGAPDCIDGARRSRRTTIVAARETFRAADARRQPNCGAAPPGSRVRSARPTTRTSRAIRQRRT